MGEAEAIAGLKQEVVVLRAALADALALIERQQQRIAELEARLAQDSHNSHLPPSRDLRRSERTARRTRSLRKPSGKRPGGQAGHSGQTLKVVATPDALVVHAPRHCQGCGAVLAGAGRAAAATLDVCLTAERRQVFDLPVVRLQSTEHRISCVACPACGQTNQGAFPEDVTQPVQYGPQVRALCVCLHHSHFLPLKRLCTFLGEWLQAPVAPASVLAWVQQAAGQVAGQVARIRQGLRQAPVVHCDESGHYVAGQRWWLHVAATAHLTCYAVHPKRGQAGMAALGLLAGYTGTAVHDGFAAYGSYRDCRHALCNVHHLRELVYVSEERQQPWAAQLAQLLLAAKAEVAEAQRQGATALPLARQQALRTAYRLLLAEALRANPPPAGGWPRGQRGPERKGKVRNLAERLQAQEEAVWRFAADLAVPFDNNLVERDIRMVKVQQKIAGCYRSEAGAEAAAVLRSYLSTLRKQGHTVYHAMQALFAGSPIPVALPE